MPYFETVLSLTEKILLSDDFAKLLGLLLRSPLFLLFSRLLRWLLMGLLHLPQTVAEAVAALGAAVGPAVEAHSAIPAARGEAGSKGWEEGC